MFPDQLVSGHTGLMYYSMYGRARSPRMVVMVPRRLRVPLSVTSIHPHETNPFIAHKHVYFRKGSINGLIIWSPCHLKICNKLHIVSISIIHSISSPGTLGIGRRGEDWSEHFARMSCGPGIWRVIGYCQKWRLRYQDPPSQTRCDCWSWNGWTLGSQNIARRWTQGKLGNN